MRLIGVLLPAAADDAVFQTRMGAFLQELAFIADIWENSVYNAANAPRRQQHHSRKSPAEVAIVVGSWRFFTCGSSASCGRMFYAHKRLTELLNANGIAVAA
jgi:hypothetical protein